MTRLLGDGLRVLVVDDERSILLFLEVALSDRGFQVETAESLATATERCAQAGFDLVLVDKNLPDGSGLTLARDLTTRGADTEVMVMSGFANLSSAVEAIQCQVADYFVKPLEVDDLEARLRRVVESQVLKRTNRRLLGELREKNETLESLATRDPLTRLFNHAHFQDALHREIARSTRGNLCFALAFIDLDGFKRINEVAGHAGGDGVLRQCGELLASDGRASDLAFRVNEPDLMARFGGDEFAVLLPETPRTGASVKGERLRQALAMHNFGLPAGVALTASVGVVEFPQDGASRDALLAAGQVALTAAKRAGGNRLLTYTPELARGGALETAAAQAESARLAALETTIATRALRCVFQPIVDIERWVTLAYEALTRAQDPAFRNPMELFATAERAGRIGDLGRVVRETAVEPLPRLPEPGLLFLNLQPYEFLTPGLVEAEPALHPWARRIVFEITEGARIHDFDQARERIAVLRGLGYRIAIDDLGSGYSSLNSLALLAPDFVKLDMAMVRDIDRNSRSARLIKHILEFCREEHLAVIAEGIETAAELAAVRELGVTLVQGYFLARPGPPFVQFTRPA